MAAIMARIKDVGTKSNTSGTYVPVSSAGRHKSQPQSPFNTGAHMPVASPSSERRSPPGDTDREGSFTRFVSKKFKRKSDNGSKPQSDANASEGLGVNLLKQIGLVKCVEVDDLSDQDIIIAVMGPTGTGKSSFIGKVLGDEEKNGIGHSLESCTTDIKITKFSSPERTNLSVVFVDTPGFDDTHRTDVEILEMIAKWLQKTYERNVRLSAILYFHRISDNRMAGTPLKNLCMFEQLCGKNGLAKIVLVTTMWDDNSAFGADEKEVEDLRQRRFEEKIAREKELKERFWQGMIKQGSTVARYVNTQESALSVIKRLLDDTSTRFAVQLQEELVDMKRQLPETHAGRELYDRLEMLLKRQQETMKKIRKETEEEDNQDMRDTLQQEYENLRKDLDTMLKEMQSLKIPLNKRLVSLLISSLGFFKLWNPK